MTLVHFQVSTGTNQDGGFMIWYKMWNLGIIIRSKTILQNLSAHGNDLWIIIIIYRLSIFCKLFVNVAGSIPIYFMCLVTSHLHKMPLFGLDSSRLSYVWSDYIVITQIIVFSENLQDYILAQQLARLNFNVSNLKIDSVSTGFQLVLW